MIDYLRQLNFASMVLRLLLAALAGGAIGLERERKKRGAGFRTYMLVALGASLTIVLSQYLDMMLRTEWNAISEIIGIRTDVSRLGAQVINGVGFLGAGTIIVTSHQEVKGLTTAAGLWASACMGLAAGAGFYEGVMACFLLILLIMTMLPAIENKFLSRSRYMNINIAMKSMDYIGNVIAVMKMNKIKVLDIDRDESSDKQYIQSGTVMCLLLPSRLMHENVVAMLSAVEGVVSIDEI